MTTWNWVALILALVAATSGAFCLIAELSLLADLRDRVADLERLTADPGRTPLARDLLDPAGPSPGQDDG